jgi:excisionase family DNA binding protein
MKAAEDEIDRAERLLEIAHVARRLSVCAHTARKLIKAGTLPAVKLDSGVWRVKSADLDAYVAARRFKPVNNNVTDQT